MISFIVPAHNEERLLGETLRSLSAAARESDLVHEIIVVNDCSTDATAAIAKEHGVRVIDVAHRQIAATRNSGARAAHGEYLIFVDADTVVDAPVVRAAYQAMKNGAVGGGCALRFDGHVPLWARMFLIPTLWFYRMARLASGAYLFCTRKAFEAVGGFNEELYAAEEAAMSRALGRQGRFVVLRVSVLTSGRKLRTYSFREVLGVLGRLAWLGKKGVLQREGLEIWYGPRREDPERP